jgi:acyl dehydratase
MYLEDFTPGRIDEFGPIPVDEAEVLEFARRYDPQPFHIDAEAAKASPFGGLIASGWHTCSMVMRAQVDHYLDPQSSLGSPGIDEVRWPTPVRPGDVLHVRATVVSSRRSASKPDRGIAQTEIVARNQNDEVVLRFLGTHIVRCREPIGTADQSASS